MTTGLSVFDTTVQDTNHWLKDIETHLGDGARHDAYVALRATLHALRDRLQPHAAVNFAAQLPMLIRGLYYEGWTLPDGPTEERTISDFADTIRASLPPRYRFDPAMAARAVFATAAARLSAGEARKVRSQMPPSLQALWPSEK